MWAYYAAQRTRDAEDWRFTSQHEQSISTQQFAILRAVVAPEATRESIIAAALASAEKGVIPNERDGFLWIGNMGLRFNEAGRLVDVAPLLIF